MYTKAVDLTYPVDVMYPRAMSYVNILNTWV
jgi:hypothetical protein